MSTITHLFVINLLFRYFLKKFLVENFRAKANSIQYLWQHAKMRNLYLCDHVICGN